MRVLLIVNAVITGELRHKIHTGLSPRKDYLEFQQSLDADVIDIAALDGRRWTRAARRCFGTSMAQALLAWRLSSRYSAIFADRETTGFALAALFTLSSHRPRLVTIAHYLSNPMKRMIVRGLRLQKNIDCVIVHASVQQQIALSEFKFTREQVALTPYGVDESFWKPAAQRPCNQICSVGLEYRDYGTLLKAVQGLDIDLVIAAASHWSKHQTLISFQPRVRVASYNYMDLRDLYAESRFVVVPLLDVDNQAGITVILEAMAMGKAVIVSHTRGQIDVIRDRRSVDRVRRERVTQPDWARTLGAGERIAGAQTGIYVTPGDSANLRQAILYLLDHPEECDEIGRNGRRIIETVMGLDRFTERVTALVRGGVDVGVSAPTGMPVAPLGTARS